jgi:rod shape-determining protein MreB
MGAVEVYILEEPMAAAIGAGLDVDSSNACMIADIGGGTSDIAIIALGGIVAATSIRYAGDKFNEAVIQYMRKRHALLIGERTAEQLKIKVGCASIDLDENGDEIIESVKASGVI